jgi:hypothetical protein
MASIHQANLWWWCVCVCVCVCGGCFWRGNRSRSVPTPSIHSRVRVASPVMDGCGSGTSREGMTAARRQKGPLGLLVKGKGWGKPLRHVPGLGGWPRARPFPGENPATFQSDPRVAHTISLASLPWPCNIVGTPTRPRFCSRRGARFSARTCGAVAQ